MYCKLLDFVKDWENEIKETTLLFSALTDESLNTRVCEGGRTLGKIAWHIVVTNGEMGEKAGFKGDFLPENAPVPASAKKILEEYKKQTQELLKAVTTQWADDDLSQAVEMYGEKWLKGKILCILLLHQAHHRGQITVLMRQAGLKVHGVCGPSREEWQSFGLKPME